MPPLTYPTFAQAKALLAAKAGDSGAVHFVDGELGVAIIEAIRTWNSIALAYRDSYLIQINPGDTYFNLSNLTDISAVAGLNNFTIRDREVVNSLQYSLYEPVTTDWTLNTPAMTDMLTVNDLVDAVQKARDQFLVDSGVVITQYSTTNPTTPAFGIVSLDEKVIDLRRLLYSSDSQPAPRIIWRTDEFAQASYNPGWRSTASNPRTYSVSETSPPKIRLIPSPTGTGRHIDYWSVSAGASLDVATNPGTLLGIPDDLVWVVRFAALANLLSRDGQARDPVRAQYCMQRYQEGVQIARRVWNTLEQVCAFNGRIWNIGAIDSLDKYSPSWIAGSGTPKGVAMIGPNIFAVNPPSDNIYTMELFVVRNAPVPSIDADIVQLSRDSLQAVINYASHLLLFKEEGAEFFATMDEYKAFFALAVQYNARLRAAAEYFDVLNDRGMLDEKFFKRIKEQAA